MPSGPEVKALLRRSVLERRKLELANLNSYRAFRSAFLASPVEREAGERSADWLRRSNGLTIEDVCAQTSRLSASQRVDRIVVAGLDGAVKAGGRENINLMLPAASAGRSLRDELGDICVLWARKANGQFSQRSTLYIHLLRQKRPVGIDHGQTSPAGILSF